MEMIQHGSKGRTVRELQQALVDLGYELDVDGDFGDATHAAVVDFQQNNELDVDGVVGPDTWEALGFEEDEEAKGGGNEMVQHGSKGSAVRELQSALVDLGYDIAIDGDFGDDTHNAVVDFQSNNGLDADGVVGPRTWGKLGY